MRRSATGEPRRRLCLIGDLDPIKNLLNNFRWTGNPISLRRVEPMWTGKQERPRQQLQRMRYEMAELAMPLFNMTILGSFLVLAVIEYRRMTRATAQDQQA